MATLVKEPQVLSVSWGVMWCHDVLNTDGTIWRHKHEVEEFPNRATAKTHVCIYRRGGWSVRLVESKIQRTSWEIKG